MKDALKDALKDFREKAGRSKYAALVCEVQTLKGVWTGDKKKGFERLAMLKPKIAAAQESCDGLHEVLDYYVSLPETEAVPKFLQDFSDGQYFMAAEYGSFHG